jgi:uncharacterized nucleotidyltransferase DUF6036
VRELADGERIRRFMRALGDEAERDTRVYFTGGATAVLLGWRTSTIDVDILIVPDSDRVYRALPHLKESLRINVELASPADFIPEAPGWRDRSPFIEREGRVAFHHYDLHAQALAKIERGHAQDRGDVREMLVRGLVDRERLRSLFEQMEPQLHRYPAIDPPSFRKALEEALATP